MGFIGIPYKEPMSSVADAILYAFETENFQSSGSCLLILPDDLKLSKKFPEASVWHPFADQSSLWSQRGHRVLIELEADQGFQSIIICCPKQKEETLSLIAHAMGLLTPGGMVIVCADNLTGGKNLSKLVESLGVSAGNLSKHKCRVVWSQKATNSAIENATQRGGMQTRADGFLTQPGLFSWSRLDIGTDVLLHHLPLSFAGIGADFGCGVGVLGQRLLQRHAGIQKLYCIDNDSRAIACTRRNLEKDQSRCDFIWADVRRLPQLPMLDFVVMNPPFHQGRMDDNLLGQNFITTAAAHLKPGGMLVMVANIHLPYEAVLHQHFSMTRLVSEERGFKVIEAIR